MMLSGSLKRIKTLQDLRTEKLRLRYEAMRAEDALNDSLQAIERMFTIFTLMQRAGTGFQYAYNMATGISSFIGRIFGKKRKNKHSGDHSAEE